jgi:4-hydroxy-2-oxoheptanedioate aldolase
MLAKWPCFARPRNLSLRNSKTLAKFRAGKPVRMCCLGHFIPAYVRMAAKFGYDCIWLDAEHRTFSNRELQAMLAFFHQFDIDCMLRAPTLEKTGLYRYLEDGATGIMIPHVSTPEKAKMLVDAVKFPPIGDRGQDGVGLDAGFLVHGDDYVEHANRETFLVVQIETPEAVENADAIAAVEGVDALFVGPGDLGLRLRRTDTTLTLEEAYDRVAAATKKHGKAWGAPGMSLDNIKTIRAQGAQLIAHGGDYEALIAMLEARSAELDDIYGAND